MIVPDVGAGSSMSTLSVEISTTVSPSETSSPTLTDHSRIVPSVTDSPPVGVTISTICSVSVAGSASGACSVSAAGSVAVTAPLPPAGAPLPAAAPIAVAVAGSDLGQYRSDRDGVTLGGDDLHDRAGDRGGDLRVDLVGRDLHDRLISGDGVAF